MSRDFSRHGALTRLSGAAAIQFIGSVFGSACGYAATIVISRRLGYDDLGLYALAMGAAVTVSLVSRFGLDTAAVYFASRHNNGSHAGEARAYVSACLRLAVFLGLAGAALLAALAAPLGAMLAQPLLTPVLLISALTVPALNLLYVSSSVLRGIRRGVAMIVGPSILFPGAVLAGAFLVPLWQRDVRFVAAATVVAAFASALVALAGVVRHLPPAASRHVHAEVLLSGKWFWLGSLSQLLVLWAPVFILGRFASSTDVGYFRVAAQSGLIIGLPLTAFGTLYAPMVTEFLHRKDREHLVELTRATARLTLLASAPAALALILAPQLILFAFGANVGPAVPAFTILVLGYFALACLGPFGYLLTMGGHARDDALANVASLAATMVLGVFLIPRYGVLGAAVSMAVPLALLTAVEFILVQRRFGMNVFSRGLVIGLLSFAVLALAGRGLASTVRPEVIAIGFAAFWTLLALLVVVTREDRRVLWGLVGRISRRAGKRGAGIPEGASLADAHPVEGPGP